MCFGPPSNIQHKGSTAHLLVVTFPVSENLASCFEAVKKREVHPHSTAENIPQKHRNFRSSQAIIIPLIEKHPPHFLQA